MDPGRELDALIAEKVMGISKERLHSEYCYKNYSTDITDAWEVMDAISERGRRDGCSYWRGQVDTYGTCSWYFSDPGSEGLPFVSVIGKSVPHAICLAALKVVEEG